MAEAEVTLPSEDLLRRRMQYTFPNTAIQSAVTPLIVAHAGKRRTAKQLAEDISRAEAKSRTELARARRPLDVADLKYIAWIMCTGCPDDFLRTVKSVLDQIWALEDLVGSAPA